MWWLSMIGLLTVSVVIYVGSAAHVLSFGPLFAQRSAAERDAAAQAAVSREREAAVAVEGSARSVRLRVTGGSAGDLQVNVPVPPNASVADWGARQGVAGPLPEDRLLFRTPSNMATVLSFYRDSLAAHGWHEVRTWMSRPTDGVAGVGSAISAFCSSVDRPSLLVGVLSFEDGSSEVRVLFDPDQAGPCASSGGQDTWTAPLF